MSGVFDRLAVGGAVRLDDHTANAQKRGAAVFIRIQFFLEIGNK